MYSTHNRLPVFATYRRLLVWAEMVVVVLVLALVELVGGTWIRSSLEEALIPLQPVSRSVYRSVLFPVRVVESSLVKQAYIENLEAKYGESLAAVTRLEQVERENQALRNIIENTDRTLQRTIIAAPISGYGDPLVSKGQQDGVLVGDLVLVNQALVGRIIATSPHQSTVRLLEHSQSQPVVVRTESGVEGLITGNGRNVLISEVSPTEQLVSGERVMTVGQEGVPSGILVGIVSTVKNDPRQPTQEAIIEQQVGFYNATIVEVRKHD